MEKVAELKEHKEKWRRWIFEKPDLWSKMNEIIYKDAIFYLFNIHHRKSHRTSLHNPVLMRTLNQGYFIDQIIAIGRLTDNTKGTVSIGRLLMEIKTRRSLFTRENYLAFEDLPYHWEDLEKDFWNKVPMRKGRMVCLEEKVRSRDWNSAKKAHEAFDKLSGSNKTSRKPNDFIKKEIFDQMDRWIQDPSLVHVKKIRHDFIAHNKLNTTAFLDINVRHIQRAHYCLIKILSRISNRILNFGTSHVLSADSPKYLDYPVLPKAKMAEYWEQTERYLSKRSKWLEDRI